MNLKQAKEVLRPLGLSINRKWGEYRVAPLIAPDMPPKRAEAIAYYTNDLDDAVSTGIHIASELKPKPTAGERLMPGCTCGAASSGDFQRCRCD